MDKEKLKNSELIKDFYNYETEEQTDAQLRDDFRILVAWTASKIEDGDWNG